MANDRTLALLPRAGAFWYVLVRGSLRALRALKALIVTAGATAASAWLRAGADIVTLAAWLGDTAETVHRTTCT